ncbi:MAG: elongation factor G [Verrucomicrobia bacterium]|nr:elongation factor G [Verrucomicrobiota bacterium]
MGISAHIDSGKTTLTERILYYSGKIHKIEEVRGGGDGATMDFMDLEREKGITITSAATTVFWNNHRINIIDTPGHVDFTVEVERSLRVLDGAIMVLCSVAGVQSQSITVDRQMKRYGVPRVAFVNKMDRMGADVFKAVKDLRQKLGLNAVALQIPIGAEAGFKGVVDLVTMKAYTHIGEQGEEMVVGECPDDLRELAEEKRHDMLDALSMFDDELMEDLLEERPIDEQIVRRAIKKGVHSLALVPVLMGSAFKNAGVQPLIDAVCAYLPSPLEAAPMKAKKVGHEADEVLLDADPAKPLVCMAFKIQEEQFGQLTYTRIYQGRMQKGDTIINSRTGNKVRVGRLVEMHANDRENIDKAEAGDIIAMIGVDCASGDTYHGDDFAVTCESMFIADPVISYSVSAKESDGVEKLGVALQRFMKEDPTFKVKTDEENNEIIISGMGELHLDIYIERILREYKVPVSVGPPQVNYREAITKAAAFDYTHKKQTGGRGQFAAVSGIIEPITEPDESGAIQDFEFVNEVKGGNIPSEYIGACEKGFRDVMDKGPLAAYPMVSVRVRLGDGKYHDVDSSDLAFRLASRQAFKQAVNRAAPCLLEPIMKVEVETPTEYQGPIVGDLSSRRGVIQSLDSGDELTVVNATVPLAQMFGYSTAVRSMTTGKATYTMEFLNYGAVPASLQQDVIDKRREKLKEDED